MILVSVFLLLFVLLFSFFVLIPEGQHYREKRLELKKATLEYQQYKDYHDELMANLKDLQHKNRHIITAFDTIFNPDRFQKLNKSYFSSLTLSKLTREKDEDGFAVYEVNTSSHISSPKNFYDFLDGVNKSDWIIGVNFPINFQRDGEMIHSSFTMKVYANNRDTNKTTSSLQKR
jgi:hypothetical protein